MLTTNEVEKAMRNALPPEFYPHIPQLAAAIVDATTGSQNYVGQAKHSGSGFELGKVLKALAGKEVATRDATLCFGDNSQVGDVRINDVAGNNMIKITINLTPPSSVNSASIGTQDYMLLATDKVRFRQLMTEHLGEEDLINMCYDLGIDYESLPGQGKAAKTRELLLFAQRRGKDKDLLNYFLAIRPNVLGEAHD